MSDYLVWIGEKMEKRYGMNCYFWMDQIMNDYIRIPDDLTWEVYMNEAMA